MIPDYLRSAFDIRPVADLVAHEQTIAFNLERMLAFMLKSGLLVDPLIVDRETNVVLDGNHRLAALKQLGCSVAVCQPVNYADEAIQVGTWLPATTSPLKMLLNRSNLRHETLAITADIKLFVAPGSVPFIARQYNKEGKRAGSKVMLEPGRYTLPELVAIQRKIIKTLNDVEWEYIPDDLVDTYLDYGYTVLVRRPFTKAEVVERAQAGDPFPPKSTRHLIPNRIIRLNMRLDWLKQTPEEATKLLHGMLEKRVFEGNVRRYSEPVIVIY